MGTSLMFVYFSLNIKDLSIYIELGGISNGAQQTIGEQISV